MEKIGIVTGLALRNRTWHLRMRVPCRYRAIDFRGEITRTLRTSSRREAIARLPETRAAVLADLDARLAVSCGSESSTSLNKAAAFSAGLKLAASRSISYRSVQDLAQGPVENLLDHIEALRRDDGPEMTQALLGALETPGLRLTELVAEVERLSTHDNRYKSLEQLRKWRMPRVRAVANLIRSLGGDYRIDDLDAVHARRHRAWWRARLAREGQAAGTANRDFIHIASMLSCYHDGLNLPDPPRPWAGVSLFDRHAMARRRAEIPVGMIVDDWFAPGALDHLNAQARDILLISIETGCRQSEIHDLPAHAIVLDAEIPHIRIANEEGENRREIKTLSSARCIPLVGVALSAACRQPDGFPRYRGTSNYSGTVNAALRKRGLLPKTGMTIGGLRHTWESRLIAARFLSDERAEMMGHSVRAARDRERYGDAMTLERKREIALRVMLVEPAHLKNNG